jgi:hypothetical protein
MATQLIVYTSDRGDKYEVSSMETSHLINAIGHHQHQRDVLESLDYNEQIQRRHRILGELIRILENELKTRVAWDEDYFEYTEKPE